MYRQILFKATEKLGSLETFAENPKEPKIIVWAVEAYESPNELTGTLRILPGVSVAPGFTCCKRDELALYCCAMDSQVSPVRTV